MNPLPTPADEAQRKKRTQEAISSTIGMKTPGSPVASPGPGGISAKPKTIDIGGIPHLDLPDQKFPGPLSMMADGIAGTVGYIATAPFSSDSRLEANRAGLDSSAEVAAEQKRQGASNSTPTTSTSGGAQAAANSATGDLQGRQAGHMIDNNLREFRDVGSGITAQRGQSGSLQVSNVDTGNVTDQGKRAVDDSASALRDQASNNPYWSAAAQLERMQRRRLMTDATDPSITDPSVREAAQKALGIIGRPEDNAVQASRAEGIAAQTESTRQQTDLRNKLLTETDPAKRTAMQEAMLVAHGRDPSQGRYVRLGGGEQVVDPVTGQKTKLPDQVFDSRTGQTVTTGKRGLTDSNFEAIGKKLGMPADALKARYEQFQNQGTLTNLDQLNTVDVALALASGTPPEKIAATITRLGGKPADFGI